MFNKLFNVFKKDTIGAPAIDLSLGYPRLKEFTDYLVKGKYTAFETAYETVSWDAKTLLNEGIGLNAELAEVIEKWVESSPGSYVANLFAGVSKTCLAWVARTSAVANSVNEKRGEEFLQLLDEAFSYLSEADNINPEDAEICARIIRVFMGLGVEQDVVKGYFDAAIDLVPNHLVAHLMMINYLSPKWLGSVDEMHAFANKQYKQPVSSLLVALPLFAMVEEWLYLSMKNENEKVAAYFLDAGRKAAVIEMYHQYKEEDDGKLLIPYVYNYFAFLLYKFNEKALFAELVTKINGNLTVYPWAYIGVESNSQLTGL